MSSEVYANAKYLMATDSLGWADPLAVFRGMLITPMYSFNYAQTTVADVLSHEVSGTPYTRQDITGRGVSLDLGGDRALLDAGSTLFEKPAGFTTQGLIIYKQYGGNDETPGTDQLVCFIGFPDPVTLNGSADFLVEYDTDGVIALTTC